MVFLSVIVSATHNINDIATSKSRHFPCPVLPSTSVVGLAEDERVC